MHKRFEKYMRIAHPKGTDGRQRQKLYNAWQAGRRYGQLEKESGGWSFAITQQVTEKFHEEINELYILALEAMEAKIKERVKETVDAAKPS